jgi:hypothetical protein
MVQYGSKVGHHPIRRHRVVIRQQDHVSPEFTGPSDPDILGSRDSNVVPKLEKFTAYFGTPSTERLQFTCIRAVVDNNNMTTLTR